MAHWVGGVDLYIVEIPTGILVESASHMEVA